MSKTRNNIHLFERSAKLDKKIFIHKKYSEKK
jgi:hypothetical protein